MPICKVCPIETTINWMNSVLFTLSLSVMKCVEILRGHHTASALFIVVLQWKASNVAQRNSCYTDTSCNWFLGQKKEPLLSEAGRGSHVEQQPITVFCELLSHLTFWILS
ncbi:hypothetical protein ATANTOWER_016835 [Ataeniobius toweri]|uniref:Uncharacterized protein n=1 Tax=Ataeniobius toweri TaxID=208326 RepID=A0ABU7C8L0_9TELE|nr:hypothetical protein [Ataeniobius toweri]